MPGSSDYSDYQSPAKIRGEREEESETVWEEAKEMQSIF